MRIDKFYEQQYGTLFWSGFVGGLVALKILYSSLITVRNKHK